MYINYDSNYNKNVLSDSREWNVYRIAFYNNGSWSSVADAKKYLRSFNLSDNSSDGSNITMGYVCGCKAVLEFKNAPTSLANNLTEGTQIMLYLSLKGKESDAYSSQLNTVPLVIDEVKVVPIMSGRNITVTAYDLSYLMTHEYVSSYENPTALEMVTEIATKYGLTVDSSVSAKIAELGSSLSNMTFKPLSGFTCKQTLGYIAGCFGCNARVGIGKKIYFEWYETSSMPDIGNDIVYLGGSTLSERFTVKLIETGTSENPIVYPNNTSGYSINFENPYITADLVRLIYDNKIANNKISFRSGKVKYKGNPINTSGKIVKTTDLDNAPSAFYIMKRTLNYDGGLSETIECFGESETTINYKITSPTQQKINRALSRMEEAIKKSTDVITQTQGSTFELIPVDENDASKGNAGFKIHYKDTGSSAFDDCVIMGTAGGVGLSTNNGETFATAMYFYEDEDTGEIIGAINGEVIRAGSIAADKIDTSQLKVGTGNVEGLDAELAELLDIAESAETKAENAQTTANETSLILGGLTAQENGVTVVKGSTILTGSIGAAQIASGAITAENIDTGAITAEKVNVGWQSGNCATGWSSDKEPYITVTSDSSNNNNPKIAVSTSYTSGNIDVNGIPFYASAGDVLRFGGTAYKKSTGDNGVYLKYSSKSDGTYNVVSYQNTANNANGSTVVIDKTYTVTQAGWYMITVAFNKQASGAYVTNLYCYKDVKGEMIVNGKISSIDGKTYFDLDNNEMGCANGYYTSQYTSGKLQFKYSSYDVGAIEGYVAESTAANRRLMIYSPNIIELGIGDSPLTASGSAVTIDDDQIGTMKPIWARRNVRAVNQSNINDYVEMTTDSSRGGTLYMQKRIDSSNAVWGYMYLGTDGHVYWYGSIGTVQIA